jgi:hypothetical protein
MSRKHPVRRHIPRRRRAAARRTPLDTGRWLEERYRAIVASENAKGPAADTARVDRTLNAIRGLVRAAAPYSHPRLKPVEQSMPKPVRNIYEVYWAGQPPRYRPSALSQGEQPADPNLAKRTSESQR